MLERLRIENLAIIESCSVDFAPGLNILTGETGAGKSILIGALNLVLGERASSDDVRTGAEVARVEAVFDLSDAPAVRETLEARGLAGEEANALIVRREIRPAGKSRNFLNGSPVQLNEMRDLIAPLVDLAGQHQHQSLLNVETHRETLDAFGGLEPMVAHCGQLYEAFMEARRRLKELLTDDRQAERDRDTWRFQIEEIDGAELRPGEEEALESERHVLANAETIALHAAEALEALYEGERSEASAIMLLDRGLAELESLREIDGSLEGLCDSVGAARATLEEAVFELRRYADHVESDPQRLADIEDRLDGIARLKRKYGETIEEILSERDRLSAQLDALDNREDRIESARADLEERRDALAEAAGALSRKRRATAKEWSKALEERLKDLSMAEARFDTAFSTTADPEGVTIDGARVAVMAQGMDQIEFIIATNPGEDLRPLRKIASGGELSRILLAIKSILAARDRRPTLVFDEIDVGVSGAPASRVGRQIEALAETHQILCITHLPQIAAKGSTHFVVEKVTRGKRAVSQVRRLDTEERLDAIARLFSGHQATPESRNHARALMQET